MRKILALLVFFSCFSAHALYADKKKQEQEYHVYLKTVDGKEKALNLKIPSDFRTGVKYKEDSEGYTIFLNKNDPQDDWHSMTEHISYRKIPNMDFLMGVYTTCLRLIVSKASIPEHNVVVMHEDGIAQGTILLNRAAISYRVSEDFAIGLPKNEVVISRIFEGDGHVILIQYAKRYDYKISHEEVQEIANRGSDIFLNYISITDFKGRNRTPDANIKTVQGAPDHLQKEFRMKLWNKDVTRIK